MLGGTGVAEAAWPLSVAPGDALAALTDAICQRGRTAATDERIEDITRRAVRDLLLRTVGNKVALYYETPIKSLGDQLSLEPLQNTADNFLGTLIGESVRRDLLSLSEEAKAVIGKASHEIAVDWIDKFKARTHDKGVPFGDMTQTIGAHYQAYAGNGDE
jgi:hypothetical protein